MRSLRSRIIIIPGLLLLVCSIGANARIKTKFRLEAVKAPEKSVTDTTALTGEPSLIAAIRCFGYDKPLSADKESFFISSSLSADTIASVLLEIRYLSTSGQQLHKEECQHDIVLPPGETRRVELRSWDPTHTFYYYRTPPRKPERYTPYKVVITPVKVRLLRKVEEGVSLD